MKKILYLFLVTFSLILVNPVFAQTSTPSAVATTSARNLNHQEVVRLEKTAVINKDYFASGERVEILGTVNGDAYIAGGNIDVGGVINGDLLVAGGNVDIIGIVTGDVRAAGGDVKISGEVSGNVTVLGGSIDISGGSVLGSLVAAGGEIEVQTEIGKGATLAGGDVTLGNNIGGDVIAGVGNLTLDSNAKVNGDLTYWSDKELTQDEGAIVSGKVTQNLPEQNKMSEEGFAKFIAALGAGFTVFGILSMLLLGFLFIRFFPKFSEETASVIGEKPVQSFGLGILALIFVPVLFILLLITLVGIPLAFLLLFGFIMLAYVSGIFVALFVGQKLLGMINKKANLYISFIIGLLVYNLVSFIPFVGWLVALVGFFVGIGAVLITKKRYYDLLKAKDSL